MKVFWMVERGQPNVDKQYVLVALLFIIANPFI